MAGQNKGRRPAFGTNISPTRCLEKTHETYAQPSCTTLQHKPLKIIEEKYRCATSTAYEVWEIDKTSSFLII